MREEKPEGRIKDYCVECLKDCEKHDKINGICPTCHKRIFIDKIKEIKGGDKV